ncbi:hypothetical protein IV88_GL001002 [Pediococcus argentinicus]|uniref:Uncharacterized protein n=2 Tax=Pediococcus argentinicus TaxID=480391 RepID=A0A0R2NK13_9LACO|nr:hypothetical protein IV88_GL001002 [Pediococcus argentinicus]
MMAEAIKTAMLDKQMQEVFDWSDSETPLRDAMWDHVMDDNGHDTMKTIKAAKDWESMSDDQLKKTAEEMLK